jgi:hypothetical protein
MVSVGELVVATGQMNGLDRYGPPAGVETLDALCVQVGPPVRGVVVLEAGPDPASVTALRSRTEPAAVPR